MQPFSCGDPQPCHLVWDGLNEHAVMQGGYHKVVHTKAIDAVTQQVAGCSFILLNALYWKDTGYHTVQQDSSAIVKHHQLQPRIEKAATVQLHSTR